MAHPSRHPYYTRYGGSMDGMTPSDMGGPVPVNRRGSNAVRGDGLGASRRIYPQKLTERSREAGPAIFTARNACLMWAMGLCCGFGSPVHTHMYMMHVHLRMNTCVCVCVCVLSFCCCCVA